MVKKNKTIDELFEEALVPEEEQSYRVPDNWVWTSNKHILNKMISVNPNNFNEAYFCYIDVEAIDNKCQEVRSPKEIKSSEAPSRARRKVKKDDIVISLVRPYLRNIAKIKIDNKNLIASTAFYVCSVKKGILSDYLYYYLCSPLATKYLIDNTRGDNSPSVKSTDFEKMSVPLPSLNEQKRIAEKVERLLTKIEEAKQLIEEVKESFELRRAAILDKAFRGELTWEWRDEKKLANLYEVVDLVNIQNVRLEKFEKECSLVTKGKKKARYNKPVYFGEVKDEELNSLPVIPEEWKFSYLGNISEIVRGASPRPAGDPKYFGGNIPWITVAEITKDEGIYLEHVSAYLTEEGAKKSRHIQEETLVLTNSGATLGVPKILKISGCINDGSVAFIELTNVSKDYLYYFLQTQTKKLRSLKVGAAQPNLNTSIVNQIIIPLPSLKEQREIVRVIELLFEKEIKAEHYSTVNSILNDIKQSILSKAFKGELGTNDPLEENAIELLKEVLQQNEK
ncbi:restriction endonuclease subunit S [Aureibacillus halotolerans]|uniref:Type I restriction enzyme S subunit n=1 Tax=Aureibacillus halotolerans TaxID=1508390 RepID=A0A4R6TXA7_9BACI|nr:restriction endonuclease subunit S [Aureibacillus halotolerans]TDQ37926.1 type I restriction enzyme S subunit [Aureibacillus halotolerans]